MYTSQKRTFQIERTTRAKLSFMAFFFQVNLNVEIEAKFEIWGW